MTPAPLALSKACEEFEVTQDGVSSGLLKILDNGQVVSNRDIVSSSQLYSVEGSVDNQGQFFPSENAKKVYLASAMAAAIQNDMLLDSKITLRFVNNPLRGPLIEMQINATLTKGPAKFDFPVQIRHFLQTSEAGESFLVNKLTQCLAGVP
jgi:hypothetical protein